MLKVFILHFHPFWGNLPDRSEQLLKNLIELLAAIPSVVYGLWGLFVVIPLIRPACNWLHLKLGWFPLFGTTSERSRDAPGSSRSVHHDSSHDHRDQP